MLVEGEGIAERQAIRNITWLRGDSYRLDELGLPALTLVTMGAAFHWMDRARVLGELDRHVLPGGGVVVASGGASVRRRPPPWNDTVAAIRAEYLGPCRRAGSGTGADPGEGHEDVLRRSPFAHVEALEWIRELDRDLDSVVGLQFSFSYSAPARFASEARRGAFEAELRRALSEHCPSGTFREEVRTEALIATRP